MTFPAVDAAPSPTSTWPQRWVVELMLDLCGYTEAIDLTQLTVALPTAGREAFLAPMRARVAASRPADQSLPDLAEILRRWDAPQDDPTGVDVIVGAPATIACYERSLDLLRDGGTLAFVGPGQWQHSEYGRRLRAKIATRGFAVDAVITLGDDHIGPAPVEGSRATTITVLRRGPQQEVAVAQLSPAFDATEIESLLDWLDFGTSRLDTPAASATRLPHWPGTSAPWRLPRPSALRRNPPQVLAWRP